VVHASSAQFKTTFQVVAGSFDFEDIDVSGSPSSQAALEAAAAEERLVSAMYGAAPTPRRWSQPFAAPSHAEISSPFGIRRSYNGVFTGSFHTGTDFAMATGEPVYASNKGKVVLSRALVTRGNFVLIDHGLGVQTGYWHLSALRVEEGQEVERGDLVGLVGSTGLATGPHLHWELRILGVTVDSMSSVGRLLAPAQ
jgi:murein DD-endopeptidase MepM/ murein hydrolase activator NlpD